MLFPHRRFFKLKVFHTNMFYTFFYCFIAEGSDIRSPSLVPSPPLLLLPFLYYSVFYKLFSNWNSLPLTLKLGKDTFKMDVSISRVPLLWSWPLNKGMYAVHKKGWIAVSFYNPKITMTKNTIEKSLPWPWKDLSV